MHNPAKFAKNMAHSFGLEDLSTTASMAIYRAIHKSDSRLANSIINYDPIERRRYDEAIRQGHQFITLPERYAGFRGFIVATVFNSPSEQSSLYQLSNLKKEFDKIISKYRSERSDGVILVFNEEELSKPLAEQFKALQEAGIFIALSNPEKNFNFNLTAPIDGVEDSVEKAADYLKIRKVANHPSGIRSLSLLERPFVQPGMQFLEVQSWFPQDTSNDQLIRLMHKEIELISPHITSSSVMILLDGRVICSKLIALLSQEFERRSLAYAIFAPYAVSICEDDPKFKSKVSLTRSEASAALYNEMQKPKIAAPANGFVSIKPPRWERSIDGFFVIQPAQDVDLSLPDSEGARNFINELPFIAGNKKKKLLLITHNSKIDPYIVNKIGTDLHAPLESRGGLLVLLSTRNDVVKNLDPNIGLIVRSDIDSACNALASHCEVVPPYNKWVHFRRPERLYEDRNIVRLSFRRYYEKIDSDKNIWESVKSEYKAVLSGQFKKILLNLGDAVVGDSLASKLRDLSEITTAYRKTLDIVSGNFHSRTNLKYASRGIFFDVYKNREEAILSSVYGLERPHGGWEAFRLEKPFPDKGLNVLRVHISEESCKNLRVNNSLIGDIYGELRALERSNHYIIFDIPNGIANLLEYDDTALGSLAWSYGEYYKKPCKMMLVCQNKRVAQLVNFDNQHIFSDFASAWKWIEERSN